MKSKIHYQIAITAYFIKVTVHLHLSFLQLLDIGT